MDHLLGWSGLSIVSTDGPFPKIGARPSEASMQPFRTSDLHIEELEQTRELKHPNVNAITSRPPLAMRVTTAFEHFSHCSFVIIGAM